ncbi:hypothetical protein ACS49_01220 [Bacillus cereus]|nr:hypothetical protein ACS49_01220 [Bacillus cereus]
MQVDRALRVAEPVRVNRPVHKQDACGVAAVNREPLAQNAHLVVVTLAYAQHRDARRKLATREMHVFQQRRNGVVALDNFLHASGRQNVQPNKFLESGEVV